MTTGTMETESSVSSQSRRIMMTKIPRSVAMDPKMLVNPRL